MPGGAYKPLHAPPAGHPWSAGRNWCQWRNFTLRKSMICCAAVTMATVFFLSYYLTVHSTLRR